MYEKQAPGRRGRGMTNLEELESRKKKLELERDIAGLEKNERWRVRRTKITETTSGVAASVSAKARAKIGGWGWFSVSVCALIGAVLVLGGLFDGALGIVAVGAVFLLPLLIKLRDAPKAEAQAEQTAKTNSESGWGWTVVGLIVGIYGAYSLWSPSRGEHAAEKPLSMAAGTTAAAIQSLPSDLQGAVGRYVLDVNHMAPYMLDGGKQLMGVSQSGGLLIHNVKLIKSRASDLAGTDFLRDTEQVLIKLTCANAARRWAVDQGVVFRYKMTSVDGLAAGAVEISKKSCGSG